MRYWTVEEARAYLPRLRDLVEMIDRAGAEADKRRGPRIGHAEEQGEAAIAELSEGDIWLRDPASGLVDFPALGDDGVVYFLCYRCDEPDLEWWHLPDDGFAGRKRLPRETP
jgi:hypothetical protein